MNVTMEPEFNSAAPDGVSVHATRVFLEEAIPENLAGMARDAIGAGRLLASADVGVIIFGCTSGSLVGGLGFDQEISARLEQVAGTCATTTSTAVVSALEALSVGRVAVGTPYIDAVNNLEAQFLEAHGFRVMSMEGLGFTRGRELHDAVRGTAYELGRRVNRPDADCVFLSCTDLRTFEELVYLEADLRKPVLSSNSASLWACLRALDVVGDASGLGATARSLMRLGLSGTSGG